MVTRRALLKSLLVAPFVTSVAPSVVYGVLRRTEQTFPINYVITSVYPAINSYVTEQECDDYFRVGDRITISGF